MKPVLFVDSLERISEMKLILDLTLGNECLDVISSLDEALMSTVSRYYGVLVINPNLENGRTKDYLNFMKRNMGKGTKVLFVDDGTPPEWIAFNTHYNDRHTLPYRVNDLLVQIQRWSKF
jgi:hypothetical protein